MLTKCANPRCSAEFYSLRHGRLFVFDAQPPRTQTVAAHVLSRQPERLEYFWLCEGCCKSMQITLDAEHRIAVMPSEDVQAEFREVLPPIHAPSERPSSRGSSRRLRRPSDAWRENTAIKKTL